MLSYSIMLDGGFVRRKLGHAKRPATAADIVKLTCAIRAHASVAMHRLHRIYFYDAAPTTDVVENPFSKERLDFGATGAYQSNIALHNQLGRQDHFANRLGELSFDGWASKVDLRNVRSDALVLSAGNIKPMVSQKGVDMRIGLDMASLALKKLSSLIVLVTADSDFVPAMKFARREGAQLFLLTLGHGVKEAMHHHADVVITDSVEEWLGNVRKDAPRPSQAVVSTAI